MKTENVIYEEQQKTYLILVAVFIIVAAFLLGLVLFPGFFNKQDLPQSARLIILVVAVLDLILFWSFSQLSIIITSQYLQLGFGIFRKNILLSNISEVEVENYKKSVYLGYGIRLGRDKSIGYIARGGRGVRIKMKPRDYFFSSDNPEQIKLLLKPHINHLAN